MILAGDIGGTHARLAFFEATNGHFRLVSASVFPSREYAGLDAIVTKFVANANLRPDAACFGIAGPVRNGRVETSNLPWIIESKRLADELRVPKTVLINDLEANAWGIATLDEKDVVALNPVNGTPVGNQAIIAAGTGLGEAGMYWDGTRHHIFAGEGGHADFAPGNNLEVELLGYLAARFGHVSCERVLSGPGLVNIFHFLRDTKRGTEPAWLTEEMQQGDPAAAISRAALAGKDGLSEQALDVFISIYAAETGNLALKLLATGGVYLGGGIAPKLLPRLKEPRFMKIFASKGRMQGLMESMPVKVITNDNTALMGAARCAAVTGAS
jgi:glucokinase